ARSLRHGAPGASIYNVPWWEQASQDTREELVKLRHIMPALFLAAAVVGPAAWSAATAPAAAQGVKGSPGATTVIRVITFAPSIVLAPAKERGFFAALGLAVDHTITASSAQLMGGVVDGTYDIAFTNPDNWITYAVRDGADVLMFQGSATGQE